MLLVGGVRAWCELVRKSPLRRVIWDTESIVSTDQSDRARTETPKTDFNRVEREVYELDLDAESQWLETLQGEKFASFFYKF